MRKERWLSRERRAFTSAELPAAKEFLSKSNGFSGYRLSLPGQFA
jgi:hypothetical protein